MNRQRRLALVLLLAATVVTPLVSLAAAGPAFRVIVNAGNAASAVDRRFLTDAFLKKTTRWPSGEVLRPVDLASDSPARRRFCEEVLGRSVSAVKSYWQQLIFAGRGVPPPEMDNDEEVIRYVARYSGAVGYVSSLGEASGVKVVSLK
jgi:hypothetical protein